MKAEIKKQLREYAQKVANPDLFDRINRELWEEKIYKNLLIIWNHELNNKGE